MAKFKAGKSGNPNGRPLGTPNKLTTTVKETVLAVFNDLQKSPKHSLLAFAKKHPKDFYNISAKLIPTEVNATIEDRRIEVVYEDSLKTPASSPEGNTSAEPAV